VPARTPHAWAGSTPEDKIPPASTPVQEEEKRAGAVKRLINHYDTLKSTRD
jgi:hypothetical protein